MDIRLLITYLKALGVSIPSNPAGAMTAEQIITALDASIGNFWKQGVSGAILVNDFQEDSADLAPYLNVDGRWHIPDGTIIVVNTLILTNESRIGRNLYFLGDGYIITTGSGSNRGFFLADGYGVATCAIQNDTNSDIYIGECRLANTDSTRGFFDITESGSLIITGPQTDLFFANPGSVDAKTIDISVRIFSLLGVDFVVGSRCQYFFFDARLSPFGFFSCNNGFDMTSIPSSTRNINCDSVTNMPASSPLILIDSDNGDNVGYFRNITCDNPANLIAAVSDAPFTANPLLSTNFDFDVMGFGSTKRIGEAYYSGNSTVAIATQNVWTDITSVPIGEGDLSNGIRMTANPGEFEYQLAVPAVVRVSVNVNGYPNSSTPEFVIGAFFKPSAGAYAQVEKGGYPVEQDSDTAGGSSIHADFEYTLLMSQGDTFKLMVKNTTGVQDINIHDLSIIAESLT